TENVDIETLTLEQYLALDLNNTRRRFTCLDNSTLEVKGQLPRELRKISFSGNPTDIAVKYISNVLEIASIFNAQEPTLVQVFPLTPEGIAKSQTRRAVDSNGLIPGLTTSDALKPIQKLADNSHKWHCEENHITTPDLFCIITEKLKLLNHELEDLKVDFRKLNTDDDRKRYHVEVKSIRSCKIDYDKTYTELSNRPTNLRDRFAQCLKESGERQAIQNEWMKKIMIRLGNLKPVRMTIEMADRSMQSPKGIKENILVKISNFVFPVDFIVLYIMEDENVPIILGRPMLETAHEKINVYELVEDKEDFSTTLCDPEKRMSIGLEEFDDIDDMWDDLDPGILSNEKAKTEFLKSDVSDEDKKKGIRKPKKKIKGFYRGCLSLGNKYKYDQEVVDWIRGCIDYGMT
ncbi:homeodomain-like protein, partial [Tanacetum coccineum]